MLCLRVDVEAGGDADALERPAARELLANLGEDGHGRGGPLDAAAALGGEGEVADLMLDDAVDAGVGLGL